MKGRAAIFTAIVLIIAAGLLPGCAIAPEENMTATVETAPTPQPQAPADPAVQGVQPLEIARDVRAFGSGYIVYPRVFGVSAEKINSGIYDAVSGRAADYEGAIFTRYRIKYNDHGIFSAVIRAYDFNSDELLFSVPVNFDAMTGEKRRISDYLYDENDLWRTVLPDMITAQAEQRELMLLSDIAPITDDQDFYITGGYLVVVYRAYEIATFAAGAPEFRLPLEELEPYIREGSALWALVEEE